MITAEKSPEREEEEEANPRAEAFLEIICRVLVGEVEAALSACGIGPTAEVEELVLKSRECYKRPKSSVRFFRWAGQSVSHTAYAWNLLVDILGKAAMFEPMWDAIRSMKQEGGGGLVSVATFASVFASYCAAGNIKDAIAALDVMDRYGLKHDAVALNSLLSAICRVEGRMQDAQDVFERTKATIPPDGDTFAILLEAWEKEGNAVRAKSVFGEMVVRIGWDAANVSAYDSFLSTLVRGGLLDEAFKFL
ncbi:Pentatricopeptide repeat (PPR) superfamily protein [Zea mays]|uniref:Pentatricopeptide repeat (PPR) superfamily protein n=1 Tax=Zea mays TaxID=4577 RepID=A0A1D6G5P7_MAIZE|nr:Pentatricopeptide repeat (PPR) superfamily protein [Zea mays]